MIGVKKEYCLEWVVTQKEKADGEKSQIKGRIVAKGFQEGEKP